MARQPRIDLAGYTYHVINRASGRVPIFYLTLLRYIEQNPLRAHMVTHAEDWKWGSAYRRYRGTFEQRKMLDVWRVPEPSAYRKELDVVLSDHALHEINKSCVRQGRGV